MKINKQGKTVVFIKTITGLTAGFGAGAMMSELIRKNVDMSNSKKHVVIAAAVATGVIAATVNSWVAKQAENQIDEAIDSINEISEVIENAKLEAANAQKEA